MRSKAVTALTDTELRLSRACQYPGGVTGPGGREGCPLQAVHGNFPIEGPNVL